MRVLRVATLACMTLLGGCQLGYYSQAAKGHLSLMGQREPLEAVLADPQIPPQIAASLQFSQQVVRFAGDQLALPAEDVYHQYVALEQDAVVWNVLAAPAWSLTPKTWCYPLTAAKLAGQGLDTYVGGAIAYSTLGWFADPLTTPMLQRSQPALAELLIHELAHRRLYIKNDTRFNESLATLVGREGAVDFFAASGEPLPTDFWQRREQVRQAFMAIVTDTREALKKLYTAEQDVTVLAREKARIQQQARERFAREQQSLPALAGYQGFFDGPLNNAQLNGVSDYNDHVPAFARLLEQCRRDWDCFWQQVENLAALTPAQRNNALEGLAWN
jgi:predicted aminopeptidase